MNRNITKKIFAIVTSLTMMSWLVGPGVAQGATIEELQAQIAALLSQISALQAQLTALQGGQAAGTPAACVGITFTRSLSQGMSGNDVKCLQALFNQAADTQVASSGAGSPGNETTYFGPLTKAASVKFQEKYASEILTPIGLSAGTGYVGPKTTAKLNSILSAGGEVTPPSPPSGAGQNKVSLAADTPAGAAVAQGARDVIFAKINFCAASQANTVSKIVLKRGGIAADADLSNVKLYEGSTQIGSTQAVNTTDHKVTFSSLNWTIPANDCKVLTVKASIAATGATQGDSVKLLIESASDITSTIALEGVFPISSNGMTIAGLSAGTLEVSTTTPSGGTAIAGGVDLDIAGFTFTASATEAVNIHTIIITQSGSAVPTDITNIKLFYGSTQIGSTVANLTSSGKATFDLSSSPLALLVGSAKNIKVAATIGSSVGIDDRTVNFEITDETDVTAYGANSGGSLAIYTSSQGSAWPQKNADVDIVLGGLTVEYSTEYSPSAQDYAKGSSQNSIIAFKFTTGANEGVRITQLKLKEASGTADTDISNVTLYDAVTGEQLKDTAGNLVPAASMISGYVTFGSYTTGLDTTGLFDIPKSTTKYILVKADVPTGATAADEYLGLIINNPTTDIKADGLSSQNDLSASDINGGTTTQKPAAASIIVHDIIGKGVLTVQSSANTPGATTYAPNTSDFWFAYFDLVSTGEEITVSQLNVHFETSSTAANTSSPAATSDINNIRFYDGDTLLGTDSVISSGKAEIGISLTVPKNSTKTVKVKADIPSTSVSGTSYLRAQIIVEEDITASGVSSGQSIYATAAAWPVYGNLMSSGAPEVDVKSGATPAAQTYVKNTTDASFTSLFLTASTTEDVKVTKIRVSVQATTSDTLSATAGLDSLWAANYEALDELVSNVKLFDGTSQLGNTVTSLTNGTNHWYADFTNLSLTVPQGTTKVIDVKAKILNNTSSEYVYMGVASTSGHVVANGVLSGISATVTNGGDAVGKGMTLGASGALVVNTSPDMPASAQILAATTPVMGKWKFTAAYEDIEITKLAFDVFHSYSEATGTYGAMITGYATNSEIADKEGALSGVGALTVDMYTFDYATNSGATTTCSYQLAGTSTANVITALTTASSTCIGDVWADTATSSANAIVLFATPAGTAYSLEIRDDLDSAASNSADNLLVGLKYGATVAIGARDGANANIAPGKVYLYDGDTLVATAPIDASGDGTTTNRVTFNLPSDKYVKITKNGSKTMTLKAEISDYVGATEGSFIQFALGTSSAAYNYQGYYVEAKGSQSQTSLTYDAITDAGTATSGTQYISNAMYIYATKPTVTLNSASPSGTQTINQNGEVLRFDVANAAAGHTLTINAIRFTIDSNTSTAPWDKTYNLYKSSDPSTVIGSGVSWAYATTSDTSGWVTIYPTSGVTISSGDTATYILKADTREMSVQNANDRLTVSIQPDDFLFSDGQAADAQKKVLNLPVTGNTLTY